jgi:lipoprotein-releasing system permease protein
MKLSFFVSLRYLHSKRKKIFSSFINILSILGIALGVSALIISLSIMNGFQSNITDRIFATSPHINLFLGQDFQDNYQQTEKSIKKINDVVSVSPFVMGNGLLKRGDTTVAVVLKGVDNSELEITDIKKYINIGSFLDNDKQGIVLGTKLMQELGAYIGDEIIFISPKIDAFSFPNLPTFHQFVIKGIFDTGIYDYDSKFGYIHLNYSQYIFDMGNKVNGFGVKIKDAYNFQPTVLEIEHKLGIKAFVRSWFEVNKGLFSALKMEKIVMSIVLFLIIVVASFGMVSSLLIMSIEKTKDIGILKTIGFSKKDITKIFIYQGFFIGIIGIILGVIISAFVIYFLKNYDFIKLPEEIYFISKVPINLKISESLIVIFGTVLVCLISSIYPARRAANLDIIEAIRDE